MNELSFFPMLTEELIENCGCRCSKYTFSYNDVHQEQELTQSGKNAIKLSEPTDSWKIETGGLIVTKEVKIDHPHLLYGKQGIAPRGSQIGLCIIWTNSFLTQTGYILPSVDNITPTGRTCIFRHTFLPGEIKGDLELSLVFYLKEQATAVGEGEGHLINEAGVTLGEIETLLLDFNNVYMDFPIEECNAKDQPLWWVEFSHWDDPRVDLFTKDNICLYLNTAFDECPMVGESIKNLELLIQIISTTYLLIFRKFSDEDLQATKNDIDLNPNSICSIMHQFTLAFDTTPQWDSDESLLKTIQQTVSKMLKAGD